MTAAPVIAAGPSQDGIGGTGHSSDGIGGTGHTPDGIGGTGHTPDGIGGTGHTPDGIGGTGFVGVIAGFGSICINGAEIHYDAATQLAVDGQPRSTEALALGQMVSVIAQSAGADLRATRISVVHAVVGPVQSVDVASGKLVVLGQTLDVAANAEALSSIHVGDPLAVDGSRQPNGEILVTRIERLAAASTSSMIGPATRIDGGGFSIYGQRVEMAGHGESASPLPGQEVLVQGSLAGGVLRADSVLADPRFAFTRTVRRVDLQGYVRAAEPGTLNVEGAQIAIDLRTALPEAGKAQLAGARVHVLADVRPDGGLVAQRISIERPPLAEGMAPALNRGEAGRVSGERGRSEREPVGETRDENSRPELSRPSIERPQIERPEMERPQIERPDVVRPEEM